MHWILSCLVTTSLCLPLSPARATGQTRPTLLAEARRLADQKPHEALVQLEQALRLDSLDYEANWRSAIALVAIGQETPDSVKSSVRDSLYFTAEHLARRAVRVDSAHVEGHFALGMSLGRVALTKSKKDRIGYAKEIFRAATRALAIAPEHDGAHHLLGLWHAEAMRISGFNRFMARNLLGGQILSQASWANAIDHLETAVRIDPSRIFHRLDLGRVYLDRKRYAQARAEFNAIAELPNRVAQDVAYRREAAALLKAIADKEDPKDGST